MISMLISMLLAHTSPVNVTPHWTFAPVTIKAHVSRYQAIRAKLTADDDGGTIYLDGGPSVYDVAGTAERGDCRWYGPRLDGTDVRVCAGSVVAVRLGSDVREGGR